MIKIVFRNKILCTFFALFLFSGLYAINDGSRYTHSSVLSSGDWYKIKIGSTGVYKLTFEDLKKMGLSKPQNVQIYGYGGQLLDENFSKPYVDDLPQLAIWMSNTPDKFGAGDYILFYGRGDLKWTYDNSKKEFVQTQNPYSSDSYYFVTESTNGPKLIQSVDASPMGIKTINAFDDYYIHESELVNISQTGREFYGEDFKANPTQNFSFSLTGITKDPASITYDFIARPVTYAAKLNFSVNDVLVNTNTIAVSSDKYQMATAVNATISQTLPESNKLTFAYSSGSNSDQNVRLNYFRVNYKRILKPYGAVTMFRSVLLNPQLDFAISETNANILTFDVTNDSIPLLVKGKLSGTNLTFGADNSSIHEYALVDVSKSIPTPSLEGKIINQNLHALPAADMVIIVQPYLQTYAEDLAQLHLDKSGLKSIVINPQDIYNEFSSGKPDITAYRRFLKMFYDRGDAPKYVLLFGDGTYDNRFISDAWKKAETRGMLLTYQSQNSLSETQSYVTDDYIGFLDDNEGVNLNRDKLNIAVGRLTVRTESEAAAILVKIKKYMTNDNSGIWQNNITFLADDAIASNNASFLERESMVNSDSLSNFVNRNHPDFFTTKIYEDAFERVVTTSGARYPSAHKALLDKIDAGTLVLNYVGHGSTTAWSHEYVLTYPDIQAMNNENMALWITATCDFSRYDADATSGGEEALLNPNGGAIALFSTVRIVYSGQNKTLNQGIFDHLFDKDENGSPIGLGEIIRLAKNTMGTDENKLRFTLLGDPALQLNYPSDYRVEVTTVDGVDVLTKAVQIKALSNTSIKGRIVDASGKIVPDFNGTLQSLIFDSEQNLKTHGYSHAKGGEPDDAIALNYKDFTNTIFSGKTKVENGLFDLDFVTPKDILYTNGYGKMNFMATDTVTQNEAQGGFSNYTVGGTDDNAKPETNPPVISSLFLNTEGFKSEDVVNSTPLFYAHVSDDSGINLSSTIGHNISLTIDGKISYNLTSSFVNDGSSSKAGSVQYLLPKLSDGQHSLQFRVWDVWNNSTTQDVQFTVDSSYKPTIYKFTIGGNPAKDLVRFIFNSDTPKSKVNIKFEVYSLTGLLCWSHQDTGTSDVFRSYTYDWDLTGSNGSRLNGGIYVCRLSVSFDGKASTKSQKLIVLEQ